MAAEILLATMVVSRGPLRKKRNALSVDQHDSARGDEWSSQQVICAAAHSKPSNPQPSRTVLKEKVLFSTAFLEKLSSFHKPTSLLFPNPWNEEIAKKIFLSFSCSV